MQKTLIIMAGGMGSRFGALKQFEKFGPHGELLLEYSIFDALMAGFQKIVVITKQHFVDEIRDYLRHKVPGSVNLEVVAQKLEDLPLEGVDLSERSKPWGTAHAVWVSRAVVHNYFAVINADDFYGRDAFLFASEFIDQAKDDVFGMVPYKLKKTLSEHGTVARGVCKFEGDELNNIVEYLGIFENENQFIDQETGVAFQGDESVSMNFWICPPLFFKLLEEELASFLNKAPKNSDEIYIPKVIQHKIAQNRIKVLKTAQAQDWFGVTYAADKEAAVKKLQTMSNLGKYPQPLWKS